MMKNTTNLDVKRHRLGLHKEVSVFAVLDIYKAAGHKTKLKLIAVITVLTHTEKTYDKALNFIYKLEKVESTESLISKLSKQELEAAVLIAKERQAIAEPKNEIVTNESGIETPVAETPTFFKKYSTQFIIAMVIIGLVLSLPLLLKTSAAPIDDKTTMPVKVIEKPQKILYLEDIQGHKFIKAIINNTTATFMLDTGASTTLISDDFLKELINQGFISREKNYLGSNYFQIADGTKIKGDIWNLPFVTIGEMKLENVEVVAMKNIRSSGFLLGISTLKKLGDYTIVPNENKILIQ